MENNNYYKKYTIRFNSHFRNLIESSSKEQIKKIIYSLFVTFSSQSTKAKERAPSWLSATCLWQNLHDII